MAEPGSPQSNILTSQPARRIALVALVSLFLATYDCLLNGPAASDLFAEIYRANVGIDTVVVSFLGYLVGGLAYLVAPRFFEHRLTPTISIALALFITSLLLRFFAMDTSLALGVAGVFLAGLCLPLCKFLVFYCLSLTRSVTLFVMGVAFGQVGKLLLLTLIGVQGAAAETLIFSLSGAVAVLSLVAFLLLLPHVDPPDPAKAPTPANPSWFDLIAKLVLVTMITALFRAWRTATVLPSGPGGILMEVALYALIPFLSWKIFLAGENTPNQRLHSSFLLLVLGLIVVMAQSAETWTLSDVAARQIVFFFEAMAQVTCWTLLFSIVWVAKENPLRPLGISIMVWCVTSILWYLLRGHFGNGAYIMIAVLIYVCVAVAGRFFPTVRVVKQPVYRDSRAEVLEDMAARYELSDREIEVFMMLAQGRSRQAIAESLYLSDGTVKSYISRIYHKLGVTGKDELLAKVQEQQD